jgi:hypothetical protein
VFRQKERKSRKKREFNRANTDTGQKTVIVL